MDADTDQPLPLLRLWFTLTTKEAPMDITSVTFTTGGKDYTFSGLSDEGDFSRKEEGDYQQNMLVIFDDNSLPFLTELENNRLAGKQKTEQRKGTMEKPGAPHERRVFAFSGITAGFPSDRRRRFPPACR